MLASVRISSLAMVDTHGCDVATHFPIVVNSDDETQDPYWSVDQIWSRTAPSAGVLPPLAEAVVLSQDLCSYRSGEVSQQSHAAPTVSFKETFDYRAWHHAGSGGDSQQSQSSAVEKALDEVVDEMVGEQEHSMNEEIKQEPAVKQEWCEETQMKQEIESEPESEIESETKTEIAPENEADDFTDSVMNDHHHVPPEGESDTELESATNDGDNVLDKNCDICQDCVLKDGIS